jgi:putative spermidine/putrescine transport system permease protein
MSPAVRRAATDWPRLLLNLFVVLFFVFIIAPIVVVVIVSFSDSDFIALPYETASLRWYRRILEYRPFIDALSISVILALLAAAAGVVLGVPSALALARSRTATATALVTFLLAPISIPAIVLGFGLLYYLSAIGFGSSFVALWIAHSVIAIPYVCRTVLAVYRSVPGQFEEAAMSLGADRWSTFRHVILPLIRPGIFAGALFAALVSLDNLPISFFFGSSGSTTLPVIMLSYMQNQFDPAIAAISTVQMLFAVVILLVVERFYGLNALVAT